MQSAYALVEYRATKNLKGIFSATPRLIINMALCLTGANVCIEGITSVDD